MLKPGQDAFGLTLDCILLGQGILDTCVTGCSTQYESSFACFFERSPPPNR